MPTDTPPERLSNQARNFGLRGIAWSVGLFGLVRLRWFEAHAIVPLTRAQAHLATLTFGPAARPIDISLACSGADALALCAGAILAYPAPWRTRVAGRHRRHRADSRDQHGADRHARPRRGLAVMVRTAARVCVARGAHAGDRRLRVPVDALRIDGARRLPPNAGLHTLRIVNRQRQPRRSADDSSGGRWCC